MIGLKISHHFFNQSEVKPKPILTRARMFFRALCILHVSCDRYIITVWILNKSGCTTVYSSVSKRQFITSIFLLLFLYINTGFSYNILLLFVSISKLHSGFSKAFVRFTSYLVTLQAFHTRVGLNTKCKPSECFCLFSGQSRHSSIPECLITEKNHVKDILLYKVLATFVKKNWIKMVHKVCLR